MKTKIIANYLPQYHRISENDLWWGEGYTDWCATKNSSPLFPGHIQPKVPLNENYYDLSNVSNIAWQASIAKEAGIYGFGIYHYWFSSKQQLLQKPAELLLENKDIDIHYMFIWDNASWKRTWSNVKQANDWAPLYENKNIEDSKKNNNGMLAELIYGGEEEWEKHFNYLLPFFKDERYIRDSKGRPVFMFFNMDSDPTVLKKMTQYWFDLAKKSGLPGIAFAGKVNYKGISIFDYEVDYEPGQHGWAFNSYILKVFAKIKFELEKRTGKLHLLDYDNVWKRILRHVKSDSTPNRLYSGFVTYDDSPRRGKNGHIVIKSTPQKFRKYFSELLRLSNEKEKEFVFITAWNEWGEGAYLEPDVENNYEYLKAVKKAVNDVEDIYDRH